MSSTRPTLNEEVPFAFDELFFSRANEAGIIRAGNRVFQRVSEYSWDEMLDKPHKLIRHPDMPRAVFWLLWDTIKRGEPVGTYVKDRAKSGRYYWVFAVVTPVEGGYLSVRLKPSSALFTVIEQEYLALTAREAAESLAPEDSAGLLLARLKELGFSDYPSFMSAALGQEVAGATPSWARRRIAASRASRSWRRPRTRCWSRHASSSPHTAATNMWR